MIHGIDPRVDFAFKRLFGSERNRSLLISLLNAVFEGTGRPPIVDVEYLDPYNPRDGEATKLSIVDVKVRDQSGRQYIVEMQMLVHRDMPKRLLFYWSKNYVAQLGPGDEYGTLRQTILICFLDEPLFPEMDRYHGRYQLREHETGRVFSEDIEVHIIELPKLELPPDELSSPLEVWAYFLRNADRLDEESMPDSLATPEILRAMEELSMISQTPSELLAYEAELMRLRDERTRIHQSRDEGLVEGEAKGRQAGLLMGRIQVLQDLLGIPVSTADELGRHAIDVLSAMSADLSAQLRSRQILPVAKGGSQPPESSRQDAP